MVTFLNFGDFSLIHFTFSLFFKLIFRLIMAFQSYFRQNNRKYDNKKGIFYFFFYFTSLFLSFLFSKSIFPYWKSLTYLSKPCFPKFCFLRIAVIETLVWCERSSFWSSRIDSYLPLRSIRQNQSIHAPCLLSRPLSSTRSCFKIRNLIPHFLPLIRCAARFDTSHYRSLASPSSDADRLMLSNYLDEQSHVLL